MVDQLSDEMAKKVNSLIQSTSIWKKRKELDRPLLVAHRGYAKDQDFDRNTLQAFKYAMELGADAIECDLRVTKDQQIIVHHDPVILSGYAMKSISRSNYSDLLEIKGSRMALPKITDLLKINNLKLPIFLQIKDPNTTPYIINQIKSYSDNFQNIIIMGYRNSVITNVKFPNVVFGKHYLCPLNRNINQIVEKFSRMPNIGIISPHYLALRATHLQKLLKLGFMIFPFTINGNKKLQKFLSRKISGLYTDDLETALDVIG